jgi:hypothetical protein
MNWAYFTLFLVTTKQEKANATRNVNNEKVLSCKTACRRQRTGTRDKDLLSANDGDFLSGQKLLGGDGSQAAKHVALTIDDCNVGHLLLKERSKQ